jgi:hypothetical protein
MSILKAIARVVIQTPLAVGKDIMTLGGAITDEESETGKLINDIREDLKK